MPELSVRGWYVRGRSPNRSRLRARRQLEELDRVVAEELPLRLRPQVELLDLGDRPLEVDHRPVRPEHALVLAPRVDEVDVLLRPVPRPVRVPAHVDLLVLVGDRDHLLGPRPAEVDA